MAEARATTAYSGRTAWARNLETPLRDVPAHGDRQRRRPAGRDAWRRWSGPTSTPRRTSALWHTTLVDPARRLRHLPGPARLDQQRPDDVLLLRRRPGGAPRVRHGRAARAAPAWRCRWPPASAAWSSRSPIYLAVNAGRGRRPTAGARRCRPTPRSRSGMLALVGPRFPDRLRAFLLTVVVVDDVVALVVIAIVYSEDVAMRPLLVGARRLRGGRPAPGRAGRPSATPRLVYARARGRRPGSRSTSRGVEPIVVGLAMGLLTYAYPAGARRPRAGHRPLPAASASSRRRSWRARRACGLAAGDLAQRAAAAALPPLDELRDRAALRARQRRRRDRAASFLARAFTSPITLGILLGYVVGKPVGIVGRHLAGHAADAGPAPPAGRLGRRGRRRHGRRRSASRSRC